MDTVLLDRSRLDTAAAILRRGGLIAVPTETVYGLAANGLDSAAVGRVFEAKGRPENKPVSLFVADVAAAERFCHVTEAALKLARFWPGPLTVILRRKPCVPDVITAGGEGVGIRVPDDGAVLELLRSLDFPLTGTSANLSGQAPAKSGEEALKIFSGRVDAVLDGGACPGGVPSTVLDLTGKIAKVVRLGAILPEELANALGDVVE